MNATIDTQAALIDARAVTYTFRTGADETPVLRDVELRVRPGELVLLTGPSGSGKTTLLTLVGALRALQAGEIEVLQSPLQRLSEAQRAKLRRNIGFIFQDHHLFEALTVHQTLRITMQLHRGRYRRNDYKELPEHILDSLGLAGKGASKARQLSTGQKQRVAIGRALINRPRLILADEPTASLDVENTRRVFSLLHERTREDGAAVLMVSHDTRLFDAADRVVEMVDGSIRGIS